MYPIAAKIEASPAFGRSHANFFMLTRKEAAKHLGISLPTLDRLRAQGIITPYILSKHLVYYDAEELKKAFRKAEPSSQLAMTEEGDAK